MPTMQITGTFDMLNPPNYDILYTFLEQMGFDNIVVIEGEG